MSNNKRHKRNFQNQRSYWRTNEGIHAPEVRVIDESGKQVGLLSTTEALKKAKEVKLDLVEIAPRAKPPVAKIIDFGKFRYQEEKKLRDLKKKSKSPGIKEVRFSPFIGEADYNTRLGRIKEFLGEKNKIRVVVKFKGRQMGSKKFGYDLFNRLLEQLDEQVNVDMKPKFVGRHLVMVISPVGAQKKKISEEVKK